LTGVMVPVGAPKRPAKLVRADGKQPAVLALRMLSDRDRRLGELSAMIEATKQQIAERTESCRQIEAMISTARLDASHLELDIEWHRQALEGAERRSSELGAGQRKLLGDVGLHKPKSIEGDPEAGPMISARSELSTATGGTGGTGCSVPASAGGCTPRAGHHAVLEPLAQRC